VFLEESLFLVLQPPVVQGLLNHEVSKSHTTTTFGRTPVGEYSARRRNFCLTIHNTYDREASILLVGFEPIISAGERPQTYALDRAATGIGSRRKYEGEI
jgi:hypothetical protein